MKIIKTLLPSVMIIEPTVFDDHRGFSLEVFREESYAQVIGPDLRFIQDNLDFPQVIANPAKAC